MSELNDFTAMLDRLGVPYTRCMDERLDSPVKEWTVLISPWPNNNKVVGCATLEAVFSAGGQFRVMEIDG